MDFFFEFGMFATLVIAIIAFMGILVTKLAETFGGKKKKEVYEQSESSRQGWKKIVRKES